VYSRKQAGRDKVSKTREIKLPGRAASDNAWPNSAPRPAPSSKASERWRAGCTSGKAIELDLAAIDFYGIGRRYFISAGAGAPQFCAPHAVSLTVTKYMSFSGGDFTVTDDDANGAVVLQAKGTYFSVRSHRVLHDAAGRAILLTMQRKVGSVTHTSGGSIGMQRRQGSCSQPAYISNNYFHHAHFLLFLASAGCRLHSTGVQLANRIDR
jgi:hypothetical protein